MLRLEHGQRMDREEFLRRWDLEPDLKRAELIDGVVYLASPVSWAHGRRDRRVMWLLTEYEDATPGCESASNTTWLMGQSAPQPDACLRIRPDAGGQSSDTGRFCSGAPELVVEVSVTSRGADRGPKRALYQTAGVREYVTIDAGSQTIVWRELVDGSYRVMEPDEAGIYRSRVFPGLWFDSGAYWRDDAAAMRATLQRGLASRV